MGPRHDALQPDLPQQLAAHTAHGALLLVLAAAGGLRELLVHHQRTRSWPTRRGLGSAQQLRALKGTRCALPDIPWPPLSHAYGARPFTPAPRRSPPH